MKSTYSDPLLPNLLPGRYPATSEIIGAYERMYLYLDLSTSGGVRRPVPPPDDPGELLNEIRQLLSRNAPGSFPVRNASRPLDYFLAILGWLLRGIVFLAMLATLPTAILMRMANLAPRWLLYLIHLAVFLVLSGLRTMLALMGWGYAGIEDFASFGFLNGFITVDAEAVQEYPFQNTLRPKPPYYWLFPPKLVFATVENQPTLVGPIPNLAKPDWIIDPQNAMSQTPGFLESLIEAANPTKTKQLLQLRREGFGNAVDFLIAVMDSRLEVPDLDLDGDRGYAFRPWEELPPNERYV